MNGIIIKGVGGNYTVKSQDKIFSCTIRGNLKLKDLKPQVGDFVNLSIENYENNLAVIKNIQERKNFLIRPKVSNIDLVAIIVSVIPKPSLDFLNKLIALIEDKSLDILICFNKVDLEIDLEMQEIIDLYKSIGYKTILTSSKNNLGIDELCESLSDKITVFSGNSGVGKSSLLNKINPNFSLETNELSKKINRGKHTTTHSQLIEIFENSFVVDSPGFSTLDLKYIENFHLEYLFKEFRNFIGKCKFNNCSHTTENNCEIKNQIRKSISEKRYQSYKNFYEEIKSIKKY